MALWKTQSEFLSRSRRVNDYAIVLLIKFNKILWISVELEGYQNPTSVVVFIVLLMITNRQFHDLGGLLAVTEIPFEID